MNQRPPRKEKNAFLSYNHQDKEEARRLGGQLTFAGAQIWFDDWEVQAGDSIPGKVNEALSGGASTRRLARPRVYFRTRRTSPPRSVRCAAG
jgi:hypothetical protein